MILDRLTLTDFGTYAGAQHVDLAPLPGRPITLIGGTNGAGKTTLLDGILLCLHGRRAVGSVSAREYEEHVRTRVHVPPPGNDKRGDQATSLRLAFTRAEGGVPIHFEIERSWRRTRGGRLSEQLCLTRAGKKQPDLTGTLTQRFLDDVMPPGVAGLFLFDGEKIQRLADDESGRDLQDAVRRLLGLDLLERLRADLRRYVIRPGERQSDHLIQRLELAAQELATSNAMCESRQTERDEVAQRLAGAQRESADARARFDARGGPLAQQRGELERRVADAARDTAVAETRLRDLVAGSLPIALAPRLAERLAERLERERVLEEDAAVRRRVSAAADQLAQGLVVRDGDLGSRRVHSLDPRAR